MPWTNIQNDPCDLSCPTDATEVMGNFQYRLEHVLPLDNAGSETDGTYDLGNGAFRWRNLYLTGGIIMADMTRIHAHHTATQSTWAAWNIVQFNTEDYDLLGTEYDPATGVITIINDGYYQINVEAQSASVNNNYLGVFVNGVEQVRAIGGDNARLRLDCLLYVPAGQTIDFRCIALVAGPGQWIIELSSFAIYQKRSF